jgi:glycosyltransferase involved in cell wall biosynthesis
VRSEPSKIDRFAEKNQEMKVAFFHQPINAIYLPDQNSAVEILTYEIARRLARHCDVIVYAKRGRDQKKFEYHEGVQYRRISATIDEKFDYLSRGVDRRLPRSYHRRPLFASRLYYLFYASQVARDLRSENCDIVHIQNFSQFAPIIRKFDPKIKIVLNMHCHWLTELDRAMIESRLREIDMVIGCSEYITETVRRGFPYFAKRCQTVFNGVDVNQFVPNDPCRVSKKGDIKQLLFVGALSPEKGVHVLLEAFQKVIKQYPQVNLEIVGGVGSRAGFSLAVTDDPKRRALLPICGNYVSQLEELSSAVAGHVSFAGPVPHRLLVNFYQKADVFVLPSVGNEPFGMPLIEAMAAGVPVVATRGGGTPEIVADTETGLLVERGNASALAEAILCLLSDESLRKSMGRAARRRAVAFFSWDRVVDRLLCQYKRICESDE